MGIAVLPRESALTTGKRPCRRIALMFAGGTIDSDCTRNGRAVNPSYAQNRYLEIVRSLKQVCPGHDIELKAPPYRIDSSQLTPEKLPELISKLNDLLFGSCEAYDAVVVTFGTDTLSWALPAVATAFGAEFRKCVVFASAMSSWQDGRDGKKNLIDAVRVAASGLFSGVLTVSGGLFLGSTNLHKVSHDAVVPFCQHDFDPLAKSEQFFDVLKGLLNPGRSIEEALAANLRVSTSPPIDLNQMYAGQEFKAVVAHQLVSPGLKTDTIAHLADDGYEHVILHCYANGTACVEEGPYSVATGISRLRKAGVAVYGVSQQDGVVAPDQYKVGKSLVDAGCLFVTRFNAETLHAVLIVASAMVKDTERVLAIIERAERELSTRALLDLGSLSRTVKN